MCARLMVDDVGMMDALDVAAKRHIELLNRSGIGLSGASHGRGAHAHTVVQRLRMTP
jgi:hypothetical protein